MKNKTYTTGLVADFELLYTIGIQLTIRYQNGLLDSIANLSQVSEKTNGITVRLMHVYYREAAFREWASTLTSSAVVKVTEKNIGATGAKVAIWCCLYKEATKVSYQVTFQDTNAAKKMGVIDAELVRLYLSQPDKYPYNNKSLKRYYDTLNELKRLQAEPPKSEFPDEWNVDTELKYKDNPQKLTEYWAYLRNNGWETINTQQGKKKWRKKTP